MNKTKYLQLLGNLPSGGVDASEVKQIVEEYLAENGPASGEDGVSPTVAITEIEGGYAVTITDINGPHTFNIKNGVDGKDGINGKDGQNGKDGAAGADGVDGKDGVSPTVSVVETDSGHRITITDANGSKSFDITNGVDGASGKDGLDGKNGADGKDGEDGYTPQKGVDYFTEEDIEQVASEAAKLVTIDQVDPSQVIFPKGASTTYQIGKVTLTNGSGTLVEPGGTLADFFNVFVDEKNPDTTAPSVSLTFSQAKAYEVGTNVTPSYSATLNPGSYTYGPATGITAKSWEVTDTASHKATTASGSFAQFQVIDGISYKITAKATYDAGATPVTNTGSPYEAGKIPAGSKSATSGAVTGYRNTFYGTLTAKSTITSDIVRGLASKSGKALANGNTFTITVPVGALRVVFAYPATLRDVTSVKDVNGMNAEIASSFTKQTLDVEGANDYKAISYKVYTLDFANANDKANKFTVQI